MTFDTRAKRWESLGHNSIFFAYYKMQICQCESLNELQIFVII